MTARPAPTGVPVDAVTAIEAADAGITDGDDTDRHRK
jgi:hypothetical protein